MRLTTKTRYGTRAMLDLALHDGDGPVSTAEIARRQGISAKYLESLLLALRRAGLVQTRRGAQGGHSLARSADEINLRDIYDVLEGGGGLVECVERPELCDRHDACVTQDVWARMYAASLHVLESTTLADLVQRAREKRGSLADMYHI